MAVFVFCGVTILLFRLLPHPLQDTDYLVAGTVATAVTLLVIFGVLLKTWVRAADVLPRITSKRHRD